MCRKGPEFNPQLDQFSHSFLILFSFSLAIVLVIRSKRKILHSAWKSGSKTLGCTTGCFLSFPFYHAYLYIATWLLSELVIQGSKDQILALTYDSRKFLQFKDSIILFGSSWLLRWIYESRELRRRTSQGVCLFIDKDRFLEIVKQVICSNYRVRR